MPIHPQDVEVSAIKVTRKRKRLYEPLAETNQLPERIAKETGIESSYVQPKTGEAQEIILDYVLWSAGLSLIPVPIADIIAIIAINLKMLKRLCQLYGLEFREQLGKSLIASLFGTFQIELLLGSLWKLIPGIGLAGGVISTAVISGSMTYAVGKVFVMHFGTGGTLLDFDLSKMQAHFAEKYKEGQGITSGLKQ